MKNYGGPQLANAHRTVRNNTIQIARDIPEEKYAFIAAPGVKSIAAQLVHIAMTSKLQEDVHRDKRLTTLQGYDFPAFMRRIGAEEAKPRTKVEIIELLEREGSAYESWLETLSDDFLDEMFTDATGQNPKSRFEQIMGAKEHEMHHRGQLMLIERMIGIVPHLTRAMQERMAARAAAETTVSAH